jgi:protein gp37
VIDNVVWTDSWTSIADAGCGLICVGAGEEWARKVYALRGLQGVERQVGLTRGIGGQRGQVRAAWWQEKQDEVLDWSRCRVAAHNRSLHAGFVVVHQKTIKLLG